MADTENNSNSDTEYNRSPLDSTSGEDLITHEGLRKDYQVIPELDTYGSSGVTDTILTDDDPEARMAADREIKRLTIQRMRREGRKIPLNLMTDSEGEIARYLRTAGTGLEGLKPGELPPKTRGISLEELNFNQDNLSVLLSRLDVQLEVKKRFRRFITTFVPSTNNTRNENSAANTLNENKGKIYVEEIHKMCCDNKRSLLISYNHLREAEEILALFLADEPGIMLRLFDASLMEVVFSLYPNYIGPIVDNLSVRIIDVPVCDSLRDLRMFHLNGLVRVSGIVTKRSSPLPVVKLIRVSCKNCGTLSPTELYSIVELEGLRCEVCNSTWFELNDFNTKFQNVQEVVIQESPNSIPAGRIPRSLKIEVSDDLVDSVKPGQGVDVTGIYSYKEMTTSGSNKGVNKSIVDAASFAYNTPGGGSRPGKNKKRGLRQNVESRFPVVGTQIVTNSIQLLEETSELYVTKEDEEEIKKLSRRKDIVDVLVDSFAPSIHGHRETKKALLLSLVGGVQKDKLSHDNINNTNNMSNTNNIGNRSNFGGKKKSSGMKIRGDINVLLVGDPGTAKSQFLKYSSNISNRGVYTAGKVASAAGLTATVKVDPMSGEWALEGGALVLADGGVCCIDEFDKMNEQDRTSIHEAMEQQTISISKAGIVATLSAKCSVIAAANPKKGYYDVSSSVARNVMLSDAILSRFDIILPIIDDFNPMEDSVLAETISRNHTYNCTNDITNINNLNNINDYNDSNNNNNNNNEEEEEEDDNANNKTIDQNLLKKYINYVKVNSKPMLRRLNKIKLGHLYAKLRKESYGIAGSLKIAVRHIESVIRIAESYAKLKMKNFVDNDDLDRAIQTVLNSFIGGQKFGIKKRLKQKFQEYLNYKVDESQILVYLLNDMIKEKIKMEGLFNEADNRSSINDDNDDNNDNRVSVSVKELEKRARGMEVFNIKGFLDSDEFKEYKFELDEEGNNINILIN